MTGRSEWLALLFKLEADVLVIWRDIIGRRTWAELVVGRQALLKPFYDNYRISFLGKTLPSFADICISESVQAITRRPASQAVTTDDFATVVQAFPSLATRRLQASVRYLRSLLPEDLQGGVSVEGKHDASADIALAVFSCRFCSALMHLSRALVHRCCVDRMPILDPVKEDQAAEELRAHANRFGTVPWNTADTLRFSLPASQLARTIAQKCLAQRDVRTVTCQELDEVISVHGFTCEMCVGRQGRLIMNWRTAVSLLSLCRATALT
jgi:hypothetical protein